MWILTSLTMCRCVASEMKFSSSFLKGGTNHIHSFGFEDFFGNNAWGTLKRQLMQKMCNGIQSRKAPIDALDSMPRLNTYTGRLKGRGCRWMQLLGPLLTVFLRNRETLCGHSTNSLWSLRKLMLDCHMHCEIDMEFEINQ